MWSTTSTQRSLTHRTESTESNWRLTHTATAVVDSYRRRSRSRRLSHRHAHSDRWLDTQSSPWLLSFTSDDHRQNHDSVTQTRRHTDDEDDDTNSSHDSAGEPENRKPENPDLATGSQKYKELAPLAHMRLIRPYNSSELNTWPSVETNVLEYNSPPGVLPVYQYQ